MNDEGKTKKQLLTEVAQLRRRIAELEASASDREGLEETGRRQTQDLEYLARTALELAAFPPEKDIYEYIAKRLKEITGDSIVFVNSFDEATRLIRCRAAAGFGKYLSRALKLIGRNPVGMSFPLSEEADQGLRTGKLTKVPGGIYTLALGQIPEKVCRALEKLVGIGDIHGIGITREGALFGNASIISRTKGEPENKTMVEAFINQASAALQRRLAEDERRASEHRFRELADSIADVFFAMDKEFRYTYWNKASERLTGVATADALGKSLYDLFPDVRNTRTEELYLEVLRTQQAKTAMNEYELGGKKYVFELSAYPSGDSIAVLAKDITERKRAEEALREGEERYRDLTENMNDLVQSVAPDGSFVYVNRAWRNTLGYSEEEVRSLSLWDIIHPDSQAHCREVFGRVLAGENVERINAKFETKDGRTVEVEGSANCRMADGKPVATRGIFRDVTQRKLAEEARQESEERHRDLVETTDDLVQGVAPDGSIIYVNRAWREALGYTEEEVRGLSLLEVIHPDSRAHCMEMFQRVIGGEKVENVETEFVAKDGRTVIVEGSASCRLVDGRPVATYGIFHDVTERKLAEKVLRETEEQLRQSQKLEAVGRLAGGVAHDFNNMLGAIIGYSDVILNDLGEADPLRKDIGHIKGAADRAAALTRQLLAFSRKQALQPKVLDLNAQIAGLEKMLRRLIGEDIDFTTLLAKDLGRVKADPGQIDQVIMNLAVNSRDAMPQGGRLTIETANVELSEEYAKTHVAVTPGPHVMLAITDTGCGMDEETRSKIFDPFFTTKGRDKGTGLGLSTVYGIVKQSGGNIWVYSEPGKGTAFKIYLPRVEEAVQPTKARRRGQTRSKGSETVLVVEDEEILRRLVKRILNLLGYEVLEASNGGEAFLLCEQHTEPIDLMLTDVVMPQMSGRELAERVAPLHPEMRILFMSGYTDDAIVHHGVLEPGTPFVEKPFTASLLGVKVRDVLDASEEGTQ